MTLSWRLFHKAAAETLLAGRRLRDERGQPLYREPLAIDRVTNCERGNERGNVRTPQTTKPPVWEAYVFDIVWIFAGCGGRQPPSLA
jgi:hypothetical protein